MRKFIFVLIFSFLFLNPDQVFAVISFSIANPQITENVITVDVSIAGLSTSSCPESNCYLQAAFTSPSKTRYFGFTQNNNKEWYKYDGSPEQDYIKSTFFTFHPQDGSWFGSLVVKVDEQDSDYDGPGTYNLKAWRYSGNSNSSSGDSDNVLPVNLTASLPSPTPSPQPSPSPSHSPSPSPTPKSTPKTTAKSPSPSPKPTDNQTKSVLGEKTATSTPSANLSNTFQDSPSPSAGYTGESSQKIAGIFIGVGSVLIAISSAIYLWYKRLQDKPTINKEKDRFEENKTEN
jgi:hypothetical protein